MAAGIQDDEELITGINVTPLVDIVLVLLIILMVTASYVVAKSIPMELPKSATGEAAPSSLNVSIDREGKLYLDAVEMNADALRAKVRAARQQNPETRAVISADGRIAHSEVVRVIDLLRQENVTKFAINVKPEDLK